MTWRPVTRPMAWPPGPWFLWAVAVSVLVWAAIIFAILEVTK